MTERGYIAWAFLLGLLIIVLIVLLCYYANANITLVGANGG